MAWGTGIPEASSDQDRGSGAVTYSTGSGSPPPPPDTTLEELTTWVIVVIAICLLVFFVVGLVWVADSEPQPQGAKRQGWLVWNGEWYRMKHRNVKVLQKESPEGASAGAPIVSALKPNEERRPLIRATLAR